MNGRLVFAGTCSLCAGLVYGAGVTNPQGLLEVATTTAIQDAIDATGSDGLVLGNGMLKWTGGDATWPNGMTFTTVSNLEVTVNVTDPAATLKIAGEAKPTAVMAFVKTGPGTVEFNGGGTLGWYNSDFTPWGSGWWKTYRNWTESAFLSKATRWNETTGVATNGGYTAFTVLDGTVRLNAPNQQFNLPYMPWVGGFTEGNARLEVTNHTTALSRGGWFSICRGTTTSASTAYPTLRVSDHSSMSIGGICTGNGNGRANYFSHARLEVDGDSSFTVANHIYHPEASGHPAILVTNRSVFTQTMGAIVNSGLKMDYNSTVAAGNCSTIKVETASVGSGASLAVTADSVFKYNRGIPSYYNASSARGQRVTFDGSTLAPFRGGMLNEWFGNKGTGYSNFFVGSLGLTLDSTADAWFGAVPKADGAGASLTKTGSGTLYLRPFTNMPVTLAAGGLGFTTPHRTWTNAFARSLAPAAGTHLSVAGEGALGGACISPVDDFTVNFRGQGRTTTATAEVDAWTCNNWARMLHDGTLQLTVGNVSSYGSAWRNDKIDVSSSFEITFDSYANNTGSRAWGWMLAFQPSSTSACGGNEGNIGYNYSSMTNGGLKSCAMGLNVESPGLMLGRMGTSIHSLNIAATSSNLAASVEAPLRNVFRYDAAAKTASLSVYVPSLGRTFTRTESLDLATLLGATSVYMGFTGSTRNDRVCEHCIRNIRYTPAVRKAARPGVVRTGGNLVLGAGKTLTANLAANEQVGTFALDSLTAAGVANLNLVDARTAPAPFGLPELTLADHDAWTLSGNAYWRADGSLANSQAKLNATGGTISKHAYPVTGDWTLRFSWRLGAHSNGAADWFRLNLGADALTSANTGSGLSLCLQNWDGAKTPTTVSYFMFYTNNVEVATARRIPMAAGFSLQQDVPVAFTLAYNDTAKTLAVSYAQNAATDGFTIPFDAARCFRGVDRARVSFWGQVGGCWNENVVSDFSWTGPQIAAALKAGVHRPALAADSLRGATAIVKTGDADLAFLRPAALGIPVTLAAGGLRFGKELLAPMDAGACGGWIFNRDSGYYTAANGLRIGTNESNNKDNTQSRRRVRVSGRWRAKWTMSNTTGADAIGFCIHNDPRGNQFTGDAWTNMGLLGRGPDGKTMTKCCNVSWYTYESASLKNKMGVGSTSYSYSVNVTPVTIRSATAIATTLVYDGAAKTLDVTMVQGANTFTHQFTNWDVKTMVGDDYGYLAFGSGGGGAHTYPNFDDFTFEQLDDVDALAAQSYVQAIDVTAQKGVFTLDSPVTNGTFRVAETVSVAADGTLELVAADQTATLSAGTLTLGAGAKLVGDVKVTVAPDHLAVTDEMLAVDGVTLAVSSADAAARTLDNETVALTGGAKLKTTGSLRLRDVSVDGVKQARSVYSADTCSWVAGGRVILSDGTLVIFR